MIKNSKSSIRMIITKMVICLIVSNVIVIITRAETKIQMEIYVYYLPYTCRYK